MTISEHLNEARHRFLVCCAVVAVLGVASFLLYPWFLSFLQHPYCRVSPHHCTFLVTNPLDGITLRVKIALFGGFLFGSPVIFWQAWRFITPGLKSKERRYALPFMLSSIVFFSAGVAVAYLIFGKAIAWLQSIGGHALVTEYNPNQYLSLFTLMMVVFGLTFEFPVILVALELANVVSSAKLLRSWRYAIVGIVIVAAVITPSSDPFSLFALAIPLTFFYFAAIGVGKLFKK